MSIRMLAKELYRLVQQVEKLEKKLRTAPPEEREQLEDQLRKVKAERDRLRKMLEGSKGSK